jgi:hypothetical protein
MDIAWQTGICEVWVIDGVTAWLARPIGQLQARPQQDAPRMVFGARTVCPRESETPERAGINHTWQAS